MIAKKLKSGDIVTVIAPSLSVATVDKNILNQAERNFTDLGLKVIFGEHVAECDDFNSSGVASRTADIHKAFTDPEIKAVIAVRGGWSINQLLRHIDWELIKNNPKIYCGFSNNTMLQNAIYTKTGLVTYHGPGFSTFGQEINLDYTLEYFKKCLMSEETYEIKSSAYFSDVNSKEELNEQDNHGYTTLQPGEAEGVILGGCLCDFNLLQGTEYMPDLTGSILFLEDDNSIGPAAFDRQLQSLIHQPSFKGVRGIVFGRFQKESGVTINLLKQIIATKDELKDLPIIAGADFGHTYPKFTFPIGGDVSISATSDNIKILINKH